VRDAIARRAHPVGPNGAGARAKLVINLLAVLKDRIRRRRPSPVGYNRGVFAEDTGRPSRPCHSHRIAREAHVVAKETA